MKLKELNLISFGKFKDTIFKLEDGLNIFYGENESGKTTIHTFIEGMFYGFQKPNRVKRARYEESKKYTPWYDDRYAGTLLFEKGNKTYKIERDFKRDKVKVYDNITGKDITDEIDNGEKVKVELPGLYFFDFNCLVYRNTIAIRQLENKIDKDFSKEVKDKLVNLTTTLDDDISVKNAIGELEEKLKSIGSNQAHTKPYPMAKKKLEGLKKRQKELLEKKKEYDIMYEDYLRLKGEVEDKEEEIKELEIELNKAKLAHMKKIYKEALNIKENIGKIDKQIDELKLYSNISEDDYYKAFDIQGELKILNREIDDIIKDIDNKSSKLKDLNSTDGEDMDNEQIFNDYSKYVELEEEKSQLQINSQENKIELLNSELKQLKEKSGKGKIQRGIFSILAIVSLALTFVNGFFLAGAAVAGILAVYFMRSNKNIKDEMENTANKLAKVEEEERRRKERIEEIDKYEESLFNKYGVVSKAEFIKLYEDTRFAYGREKEKIKKIDELNREIENLNSKLQDKKDEREKKEEEFKKLLEINKVDSIEHFKEALDNKSKYNSLVKEKESKKELFNKIIGNMTFEELESIVLDIKEDITVDRSIEEIEGELKEKKEKFHEQKSEYDKIEVKLDTLNYSVKELMETEEEIESTNLSIKDMEKKIKAIKIAKEVIEKVSEDIHNEFAPKLNKDMSKLIGSITDGKYSNIKIDDNLNITVENSDTKETIPFDSLSGGTIDQMYFALRFSIINSIKEREEKLPLILDDCFVQYDYNRLENILKYLHEVSKDIQILLFTCQDREVEVLDKLNLKYNLIKIA